MFLSSPLYQSRFLKACTLANQREWKKALYAYETIFDNKGEWENTFIDSTFLSIIEIYKADCLRALKKYKKAKKILDENIKEEEVEVFLNSRYLYDYNMIYGSIFEGLKDFDSMCNRLIKAAFIASTELKDDQCTLDSWTRLLSSLFKGKKHEALLLHSSQAIKFSDEHNIPELKKIVDEFNK